LKQLKDTGRLVENEQDFRKNLVVPSTD